jgi:hypothetical protein
MIKGWWHQQGLALIQGVAASDARGDSSKGGDKGWYMYEQGLVILVRGVTASMDGINSRSGSSKGWQQQRVASVQGIAAMMYAQ